MRALEELEATDPSTCGHYDCLIDEVAGSINANLHGGKLTQEQADYLFKRYVYDDDTD